jgi:diguanylate cyclase (GGDEF)-like protein
LEREVERSKRSGKSLAIMMIDVDGFKSINDTYGHVAGDGVLKDVAALLQHDLRKSDVVCRYGGDEFIVIMPEISEDGAAHARDRLRKRLDAHNAGSEISIGLSIGIHVGSGTDPDTIIRFVDEDLYDDKSRNAERNIENVSENLAEMLAADDSQGNAARRRDSRILDEA